VNRGGENPIADRLNRVNEDLKTDLEKSRFFNRTAPIHDRTNLGCRFKPMKCKSETRPKLEMIKRLR
jgi:hypothetical protein